MSTGPSSFGGLGAPGRGGVVRQSGRGRVIGAVGIVLLVLVSVALVAGVQGGVGPLSALGRAETPLQILSWRPTSEASVIEVGVRLEKGLCSGESTWARGVRRDNRLEVDARLQGPRVRDCPSGLPLASYTWVPVTLDDPLPSTVVVVGLPGRVPVPKTPAA